jgi:hypothetical protein
MDNKQEHFDNLAHIRAMMEQSARFLSLSGLSGVAAGVSALLGALALYVYAGFPKFGESYYAKMADKSHWGLSFQQFIVLDACVVLLVALASGYYFTWRKTRAQGQTVWTRATRRMASNLFIPLATGGLFCLALIARGHIELVAPSTLIFYGLACITASKYTLDDLRYLGLSEIALGLLATVFIGYGLMFWIIGFGLLHILYGIRMHLKYK